MGCFTSKNSTGDEYVWNPKPQESKRITLQSTGTLQILLQQPKLRDNFRSFIYLHWIPAVSDFYIDVKDYSTLKKSTFQIFRSCFIYEKYLMHGASRQIPISINTLDDCSNALFGNCTEEDINSDIFCGAEADALDFLMSEVYPNFEKSPLSSTKKDNNKELLKIIKGSGTDRRRKASFFKSPEREILMKIMNKVLNDKEYSDAFKKYLITVNAEKILYAYYEAVELSVKMSELHQLNSDSDIKHSRFLHLVNGFYDTYISTGAHLKINITEATYGDFMRRLYSRLSVEQEVFLPVELETFDTLFRDHLGEFLVTADYRQLVRKGHRTVFQMFKQLNMDENCYSLIAEGGAGGICDDCSSTSSFDIDNELFDFNGKSKFSTSNLRELKSFLRSGYDGIFGAFLAVHEKLSLMHFYQSATRYEESHFNHDVERVSECSMIFERYISRNADDQISLPSNIRLTVTKQLFRAEQDIYSEAADWTIKYLCCNYWSMFVDEVHKTVNENRNDNITMGSAGTVSLEDKNAYGGMIAGNSDKEFQNSMITPRSDASTPNHSNSATCEDALMFRQHKTTPNMTGISSDAAPMAIVTEFATLAAKKFPPIASPDSIHDARRFSSPKTFFEGTGTSSPGSSANLNKILPASPQASTNSLLITEPSSPKNSFGRAKENSQFFGSPNKCEEPAVNSLHRNSVLFNSSISAITSANFSVALQRLEKKAAPYTALEIIDSSACCSIFKEFLDKEGLAQTLLFFIEVEEFRRIPHTDFQSLRAKKICNKYINDMAIMPIPISNSCRAQILLKIDNKSVLPTLFQQASDEVQKYIEMFQFPRFQISPEFVRVASILTIERHSASSASGNRRGSRLNIKQVVATSDMTTLKQILQYQLPTRYFKDFCVRTFCSENIFFWLDVENYMNLPGSDYMKRMACKIYKKYIADDSKTQVNISYTIKQDVFNNLMSGHRYLFKNAQHEVFLLMNSDSMPKFVRSQEYELLRKCMEAEKQLAGKVNSKQMFDARSMVKK